MRSGTCNVTGVQSIVARSGTGDRSVDGAESSEGQHDSSQRDVHYKVVTRESGFPRKISVNRQEHGSNEAGEIESFSCLV